MASNPTAVAVHEARTVYPGVPLELVVSVGTGGKREPTLHCLLSFQLFIVFVAHISLPLLFVQ